MAQLEQSPPPISASTQLLAICWLRWRIFANGFRRRPASGARRVAGLIGTVLLRLIFWPIFAAMAIGPAIGAGFAAYSMTSSHHPEHLSPLLAGVALLWQFVAVNGVNIAAQMSTFDPASLLRYPLAFGRYLLLRLALGLFAASTFAGCLALLAVAIGIGIAAPPLAAPALAVLALYAALNLLVSRSLAIWAERWLSTRRAREVFGALMALFFVSVQLFTIHHPSTNPHTPHQSWVLTVVNGSGRFLVWFPPGFAANAILPGSTLAHLAQWAGLLLWTALFFAALTYRLHRQFLGEYLAEGEPRHDAPVAALPRPRPSPTATAQPAAFALLSPSVAAGLRKEWLSLRSNGNQLIAMITPLIFVFILGRGTLARHPSFLLAGAVGYAMLGLLGGLFNVFGSDGPGVQLYLLAPIRLRDIVLAKNLWSGGLVAIEATLAWSIVLVIAPAPIPLATQLSTFFWVAMMLFAALTVGTLRSIQAPRKISLAQTRAIRTPPANRTSGLLVMALVAGSMLLQIPVILLARHWHMPWLGALIFAPLAALAAGGYALLLHRVDRILLNHRDLFAEELCKA